MKLLKRERIELPEVQRKTTKHASKAASFGVLAACLGVIAATVAKGIQLDKKEAADKELNSTEDEVDK